MNTENQAHAPNHIDAHIEFSFKGENFEQHPRLKAALIRAYQLGVES